MLALVGASMSWALGSVLSRRVPLAGDKTLASAMSMLAGGVVTLGIGAAAGELSGFEAARVSAAWAYLVVFGSMLGFTCFTWLVSVVDPTRVATYAYVNPVVALLLGWWLAGEPLGGRTLLATPIILAGLVLVLRPEALPLPRRRPRAELAA
jgi:drug/metabolite transporter (DMT)-like permease